MDVITDGLWYPTSPTLDIVLEDDNGHTGGCSAIFARIQVPLEAD